MAAPAGASLGVATGVLPNETLDRAIDLGRLSAGATLREIGSLGNGPYGAADVEWYSFALGGPARVIGTILRQDPSSSFNGVLSLFNSDPGDWGDPYNPDGHRLLQQVDGRATGGVASIDRLLGPGTYYLAVSGDGNFDFHPLLAGSGLPGSTGDFSLRLLIADAGLSSAIGPQVLTSDPAPGAVLNASPLAIRVDLSAAIDPWTVIPGVTAQLIYSPTGAFDQDGQQVPLTSTNFSPMFPPPPSPDGTTPPDPGPDELQLFPASPLAPGYYQVVLDGLDDGSAPALLDASDLDGLGADAAHPLGQDITIPFRVAGIDGVAGAIGSDDTAATARDLGDVTSAGLVRVTGAIGVDPFYNPNQAPDPSSPVPYYVPADQVDMYHLRISGPGNYSLVADVFAGRIGSPLDPGVSLFRLDPATGVLTFVAGDNNTYDTATTTDGLTQPLYTDAALQVSLTAGDYYLAVANGYNTPSPAEGVQPGSPGLFDPNLPDSGTAAYLNPATGPYVLDLHVRPASIDPPHVLVTSPGYRDTLDQPPTQVTVRFDEPVDIAQLAFQTYQVPDPGNTSGLYIEAADGGMRYFPRFVSFDRRANLATFAMLDGLPNGQYTLHVTGEVTDLSGNPLVGNDPSGDYVVPFTVNGPPRGSGGNPRAWVDQEPNDDIQHPQDLGILFPNELAAGVTISRAPSRDPGQAPPQDTADVYEFQVLLGRTYTFTLLGNPPPAGVTLSLTDASGEPASVFSLLGGRVLQGPLDPGTYRLEVSGWRATQAADLTYTVSVKFITQNDNAPPLLTGPAPAVAIQLDGAAPPTSAPPPPPVTTPPVSPPPVTTPPVSPPPEGSPPVTDSSPAGPPPSSGTDPSTSAAAPAVLAIAIPPQLQGGPAPVAASPLSPAALGTPSIGGVIGTEGTPAGATQLAQYDAALPPSSLATGLIMVVTSLSSLGPGEEAVASPAGPEEAEGPMTDVGERGAAAASPREIGATAGSEEEGEARPPAPLAPLLRLRPAAPAPRGESPAEPSSPRTGRGGMTAPPSEPDASDPRPQANPTSREELPRTDWERARVLILGFTGLAVGAYVRCRGLAVRVDRRGGGRGLARTSLLRRRPPHGVGIGRGDA